MQVNTETIITDSDGEFTASLENSTLYTLSTGLAAISFDPILETGGSFSTRTPVIIKAQRLITLAEPPCRILINGVENIYIASTNATGEALTVPITLGVMNQILSFSGTAVPPEVFPPGTSGFSTPASHFSSGASLLGRWNFLGQEIEIGPDLPVCADRGVPGQCEVIDPTVLSSPFNYTRQTIVDLAVRSLAAARSGKWKGTNGRFSVPFMVRGAKALARMDRALQDSQGENFACDVVPMSCSVHRVPKTQLSKAFSSIFVGRVPQGLEHISRQSKRYISGFNGILKKLPETYVKCD